MKHKTWFRLVLKAIGVYMAANGLLALPSTVVQLIMWSHQPRGGQADYILLYLASSSHAVLSLVLGLYLFFGGKWIVDKAIPSNRPYCPECGYELTGTSGDRCPECGTTSRQAVSCNVSAEA